MAMTPEYTFYYPEINDTAIPAKEKVDLRIHDEKLSTLCGAKLHEVDKQKTCKFFCKASYDRRCEHHRFDWSLCVYQEEIT